MSNDNRGDGDAISRLLSEAVRGPVGETAHVYGSRPVLASWEFTAGGTLAMPNQNDAIGHHWAVKNRMKKNAADVLGVAARAAGVPLVSWQRPQVRRVRMAFAGWSNGQTLPDPDNLMKYHLDALVASFVLVDDSETWCEWAKPELVRSPEPRVVCIIEDIEYRPGRFTAEDQLPQMVRMLRTVLKRRGLAGPTIKVNPIAQTGAVFKQTSAVKVNRAMRRKFRKGGK